MKDIALNTLLVCTILFLNLPVLVGIIDSVLWFFGTSTGLIHWDGIKQLGVILLGSITFSLLTM